MSLKILRLNRSHSNSNQFQRVLFLAFFFVLFLTLFSTIVHACWSNSDCTIYGGSYNYCSGDTSYKKTYYYEYKCTFNNWWNYFYGGDCNWNWYVGTITHSYYNQNCNNDYSYYGSNYCSGDYVKHNLYYHNGYCSGGYCRSSSSYWGSYTVQNCNNYDSTGSWQKYCSGDYLQEKRLIKNGYCAGSSCQTSSYYQYNTIQNCNYNDYTGSWQKYCDGNTLKEKRYVVNGYCSGSSCATSSGYQYNTITNCEFGCSNSACLNGPDLTPNGIVTPTELYEKEAFTLNYYEKNIGDMQAGSHYYDVYVDGALKQSSFNYVLYAGQAVNSAVSLNLNKGYHLIQIKSDTNWLLNVKESNENNNIKSYSVYVKEKQVPPLFEIQGVTVSDSTPQPGETITFTIKLKNDGGSGTSYVGGTVEKSSYSCNTQWTSKYLSKANNGYAYINWKVPSNAASGYYNLAVGTWDSCWNGCEGNCYTDGCCNGNQNTGEYYSLFKVNRLPVISELNSVSTITEGEVVNLAVSIADPEGTNINAYAYLDGNWVSAEVEKVSTGKYKLYYSWKTNQYDSGTHSFKVKAYDSDGDYTEKTFSFYVQNNNPPEWNSISTQSVKENESYNGHDILKNYASDPEQQPLQITCSAPLNSNCYWLPSFNDAGTYTVTATASDGLTSSTKTFTLNVINVNRAPAIQPISNIIATAGDFIKLNVTATDPDGDAVTINYPEPFNSNGEWQTKLEDANIYQFKVNAFDTYNTGANESFNLTLLSPNSAPSVESVEITPENATTSNDLYCLPVNSSDDNTTNLTYYIKWLKNDEKYAEGTASNSSKTGEWFISSSLTSVGNDWQCSIIPNDGELNGSEKYSQKIIIKQDASTAVTSPFQPINGEGTTATQNQIKSNTNNSSSPITPVAAGATAFLAALAAGAYLEKKKLKVLPEKSAYWPENANKEWDEYLKEKANDPGYIPVPPFNYTPRVINFESPMPDIKITPISEPDKRGFEPGVFGTTSAYYQQKMLEKELQKQRQLQLLNNQDISNEGSWSKISRGWGYKFGSAWNIVKGWGYKFGAALGGVSEFAGKVVNDPVGSIGGFFNGLWNGLKGVANAAGNYLVQLAEDPIGTMTRTAQGISDAVVNGAAAYWNALKNNPIDTLAKTAIVVGGVLLAIPSGGTSLVAAGVALGAVGATAMIAEESYGYANAKTEEELKQDAVSDTDDLLWIGGGFLEAAQGVRAISVAEEAGASGEAAAGLGEADDAVGSSTRLSEGVSNNIDDVASRLGSKYGDDIANLVRENPELAGDVESLITKYGENAAKLISKYGKTAIKAIKNVEDYGYDAQKFINNVNKLKTELVNEKGLNELVGKVANAGDFGNVKGALFELEDAASSPNKVLKISEIYKKNGKILTDIDRVEQTPDGVIRIIEDKSGKSFGDLAKKMARYEEYARKFYGDSKVEIVIRTKEQIPENILARLPKNIKIELV